MKQASESSTVLSGISARLICWLWDNPSPEESPLLRVLRNFLKIISVFFREFKRDNIPLRASALTFTIVLSLVPTLALGTAVLKGLGAGDQMRQTAYRFIDQLDSSEQIPPSEEPAAQNLETSETEKNQVPLPSTEKVVSQDQQLTGHLRTAADQIFDYVDRTDFTTLGAFGVIGLVLAVLSVLGSIEQAMNKIWQADSGRPLGRKLMDYLALMILLPLSVNLALATEAMIQNQSLLDMVHEALPIAWFTHFLLKILPAVLIMLTFSVLYRFLPNTRVKIGPSLVGGAIGGICWLVIQAFYLKMQIGVARYNAIYGSFATLPLFLLWLYVGWVVFLAGSEASFACQVWREYIWNKPKLTPLSRLALSFTLMEVIGENHKDGRTSSLNDLDDQYPKYSKTEINSVLKSLEEGGLLYHVQEEAAGYVPAMPIEKIKPFRLVELILGDRNTLDHPLALEAIKSASAGLAGKSLVSSGVLASER